MRAEGSGFAPQANSHWPFTAMKEDTAHPLLIHWADVEAGPGAARTLKVERRVPLLREGEKKFPLWRINV